MSSAAKLIEKPDEGAFEWVEDTGFNLEIAREIRVRCMELGGVGQPVELIGVSPKLQDTLSKLKKFAKFNQPILITGESGVGKEFFAKACYVLSNRTQGPYISVNCPQYGEGNLTVSELFGHVKGSFTGATSDHKGVFEIANGGVVFLDEVGDLHPSAQTMLLRALAENEVKPLGSSKIQPVNVRVIAATNRQLREMMAKGEFRQDLYFRLRYFPLDIPALREREEDWKLLVQFFVQKMNNEYGLSKSFSPTSFKYLELYSWPGNVRELKSVVSIGYSMAEAKYIEPDHFEGELQPQSLRAPVSMTLDQCLFRMLEGGEDFWAVIQEPFLDREMNRSQVRDVINQGLVRARGSYRRLALLFNLDATQYQKFMDFLRHHRLKPDN
jgi:transcriptional regulator with GAF, ATPase, and Fis domain